MNVPPVSRSAVSCGVLAPAFAPFPWYTWIRPVPVFRVNSLESTPILSSTHSSESTLPVEIAVSGMLELPGMSPVSPACVRGMWMSPIDDDAHAVGTFTYTPRRHRPSWMTIGMLLPTGTFVSVNVPSNAVVVDTRGLPETSAAQPPHDGPVAIGESGAFGTYTSTLGTGSGLPNVEMVPAT